MLALFTVLVGFLGTLVLVLMSELIPRSFAEWRCESEKRHTLLEFCMLAITLIGGYIGYRLGS
jgi:hypothetical protein